MGKSGYLPDISGIFVRWRQHYLEGLEISKWGAVSLGLNNMNGALDEEYRLPINTKKWGELEDGYIIWECGFCTMDKEKIVNKGKENEKKKIIQVPTVTKREDVTVFEEICSDIISILSGHKKRKMWICPSCKNMASVESVESALVRYAEPHYRGCIYKEPTRPLTGLMRRRGSYPEQMKEWAKSYSVELEHQLALYRLEYIAQHGMDMGDMMVKDRGDQ